MFYPALLSLSAFGLASTVRPPSLSSGSASALEPGTIVGCSTVGCPPAEDGTRGPLCRLAGKNFSAVGLAAVSGPLPAPLAGFGAPTWLLGVAVADADAEDGLMGSRMHGFDRSFYLGLPRGVDLVGNKVVADGADEGGGETPLGVGVACALFFTNTSRQVAFPNAGDPSTSQGSCVQAMSKGCVDALVERTRRVEISGSDGQDACLKVSRAINETPADDECRMFANGKAWSAIVPVSLIGPDAPQPISDDQNATSNCWPVLPKSESLTPVKSFRAMGDDAMSTLKDNFYNITLIMTVLYPGNGSAVGPPWVQMTCLKTIGMDLADNATQSSPDSNKPNASRGVASGGVATVAFQIALHSLVLFL